MVGAEIGVQANINVALPGAERVAAALKSLEEATKSAAVASEKLKAAQAAVTEIHGKVAGKTEALGLLRAKYGEENRRLTAQEISGIQKREANIKKLEVSEIAAQANMKRAQEEKREADLRVASFEKEVALARQAQEKAVQEEQMKRAALTRKAHESEREAHESGMRIMRAYEGEARAASKQMFMMNMNILGMNMSMLGLWWSIGNVSRAFIGNRREMKEFDESIRAALGGVQLLASFTNLYIAYAQVGTQLFERQAHLSRELTRARGLEREAVWALQDGEVARYHGLKLEAAATREAAIASFEAFGRMAALSKVMIAGGTALGAVTSGYRAFSGEIKGPARYASGIMFAIMTGMTALQIWQAKVTWALVKARLAELGVIKTGLFFKGADSVVTRVDTKVRQHLMATFPLIGLRAAENTVIKAGLPIKAADTAANYANAASRRAMHAAGPALPAPTPITPVPVGRGRAGMMAVLPLLGRVGMVAFPAVGAAVTAWQGYEAWREGRKKAAAGYGIAAGLFTAAALTAATGVGAVAAPFLLAAGAIVAGITALGDWAGWWQRGGVFLARGPTLFGAGERGPERVTIERAGRVAGRGDMFITIVSNDPKSVGLQLRKQLAYELGGV